MSRKASLLTTEDVPKYIRGIAPRLRPVDPSKYTGKDNPGYTFDLYGKWKLGYESQLHADCEKLIAWAKSWYADAYVVSVHFWPAEVPLGTNEPYGCRSHMRRAYQMGYRNHIRIVITDPVALRFEKDNFYKKEGKV